ncbi:GntR family transcriptional regulator [Rhizobium sullae]|uniref:GntR family transcriptional regulator n=2 Tax=Rhizobium sullae TaxID=50338 RepID=A0A4R3Q224_RHISU|nr:GntR family transcriptional regulator [Rhizobium sullae]
MSDQFSVCLGRHRGTMKANVSDNPLIRPLPVMDRARQVTEALAHYVDAAKLKTGDRLPAERELMAALAVGRSTIREAIRHFQALGVIETRKGSGTYLLKPVSKATIHMPLSLDTAHLRDVLLQTLEVRRGIECEAGMVAARRRTARDLVIIEEKLGEMERVHHAKGTSGPEDLAFHMAVYDATHNPLFGQLLEQMREAFERFWTHPFDREDFARRSFPFHRTLFNAIGAQDAEAAREETLKILEVVEEDIKEMSK